MQNVGLLVFSNAIFSKKFSKFKFFFTDFNVSFNIIKRLSSWRNEHKIYISYLFLKVFFIANIFKNLCLGF